MMESKNNNFSRAKALLKNIFIIGLGNFLPKIATFITLPIITGYLTKAEYGTYDLIAVLLSFILPIATLEVETAAFRVLISARDNNEEKKRIISTITGFVILTSLLAVVITYFFLDRKTARLLICIYLMLGIFKSTLQQIVRGIGYNIVYSVSSILNALINLLLVFYFVKICEYGFLGAIFGLIAANAISCLVLFFIGQVYRYVEFKCFSFECLKSMISFSWPMIPNDFSSWVMYLSDRLVLTMFCGIEVTAVYAVANKIPNLMAAVLSTFNLAWHENASLYSNDVDSSAYYTKMFEIVFGVLAGTLAVLIAVGPILFKVLIRGDYADAYPHMLVLLMASLFNSISSFLAGVYVAKKQTKEIGITTTVAAIINICIDIILVKYVGIWAASISTLVSYTVLSGLRIRHAVCSWRVNVKVKRIVLCVVFLIILCILSNSKMKFANAFNLFLATVFFAFLNRSFLNILWKRVSKKVISLLKI